MFLMKATYLSRLATAGLAAAATFVNAWGETPDEVAHRSRALLTDPSTFGVGILSSTYPTDFATKELKGLVTSGSEYFAPCYANGDLLLLAMPVSQNWRNALYSKGRNATLEIISNPDPAVPDPRHQSKSGGWDPERPKWRRGIYSKQRLTLFGHLETMTKAQANSRNDLQSCYLSYHADATHFIPGSDSPHLAIWTTFIVDRVYRVGGYGDESQIGWLDMDKWRQAGRNSFINWQNGWKQTNPSYHSSFDESRPQNYDLSTDRFSSLFAENAQDKGAPTPLIFQK